MTHDIDDGLVLGGEAVRAGLVTAAELRGPAWRRLLRGVYVPAGCPVDHELMCRAALKVLPEGSCVIGRSAARVRGATWAAGPRSTVEVAVGAGTAGRTRPGMTVRRLAVPEAELEVVRGLRLTSGLRTAWDVAAYLDESDSMPVLDQMLGLGLVDPVLVRGYAAMKDGAAHVTRGRRAIGWADGRSESPPESKVRTALLRAGLRPVPQVVVTDGQGRFVARVDLGFEDERVAVEYEGAHHSGRHQLSHDRERLNRLQDVRWRVVFATSVDLPDLSGLVQRVQIALTRRR